MPTKKPRVTFAISTERLNEVNAYSKFKGCKNLSQAILLLIDKGLSDVEMTPPRLPASPLQETLLSNFSQLSIKGKRRLVETADTMVASGKYAITDPPPIAQIAAKGGDGVQTIPLTPQQAEAAKKAMEELPD